MKKKSEYYDAVIVGAGMAGLGAALGFAKQGKRVLVISHKKRGESSPAAGGILDPFLEMSSQNPLFKLCESALLGYPAFAKEVERATKEKIGFSKTGMLYVAKDLSEWKELKKRFNWQKNTKIPARLLSAEEIINRFPEVCPSLSGGLFYPTIARVHPKKLVRALIRWNEKLGVRFLWTQQNSALLIRKQKVEGIRLGSQTFFSKAVVNATGCWAGKNKSLGKCKIIPVRGQILLLQGRQKISTILHSLDGGYAVPWDHSGRRYLIGSTVEYRGYQVKTTAAGKRIIFEKNQRIFPALNNARIVDEWAGLRPFPEGRMPFIGPDPLPGYFWAAGYYRSGILISLLAGELLAKGIISGKMPALLKSFDPRRS